MTMRTSRKKAWDLCESLGLPTNPNLPELERELTLRSKEEIANRALALYACVAVSFGYSAGKAKDWLSSEGLVGSLTELEQSFLESGNDNDFFQEQVEALYVLSWLAGSYLKLDLIGPLPDCLVHKFPDLKISEAAREFIVQANPPANATVLQSLENAYCLDWAIVEKHLNGEPVNFESNIKLRRKALEWAMTSTNWDDVALDT